MGINTFLPTAHQFEERQKINLPDFGKKYKIKTPINKAIYSKSELKDLENLV